MRTLSALWFTLRALLRRRDADTDVDEELSYHLERETALYEHRGMSRDDARREALRQFGGVQRYREECRDVRRTSWIDDARADVRYALRLITLHPAFSANVVIITAVGVAVCASTFSVVSGVLFAPLPFPSADHVAAVQLRSAEGSSTAAFPTDAYLRIARDTSSDTTMVDAIAAYRPGRATVEWNGEPEQVSTELVTPSFFRAFGVAPVIGRAFTETEAEQRTPVVMLGYALWRARFQGDAGVVGRHMTLDSMTYTIVGVTPPRFRAHFTAEPALWLPLTVAPADGARNATVNAVLRTRAEVSQARANAWVAALVQAKMPSNTFADSVAATATLVPIAELIYGYLKRPLLVFLAAVLLVVALVAANVTTMFLARGTARERELSLRRALGASAGRQLRQLVTESGTLTAIGGAFGIIASYWIIGTIRGLGVRVLPRMDNVALDWRVLSFAAIATGITALAGGLAPAFSARRTNAAGMRDTASTRVTGRRTSATLVVAQITLSVVLLVAAGLLMKSFLRLVPSDPGFALENRATLSVSLHGQAAFPDSDERATQRFVHLVEERMRRARGVRDVAVMSFVPFSGLVSTTQLDVPGAPTPAKPFTAFQNPVTPNYFDVMRIDIRRGRAFGASDDESAGRVAIVNETAAARWWPGMNPLGRQLLIRGRERYSVTVVGVARDGRLTGNDTRVRPEIFFPLAQANPRSMSFIVHTSGDPRAVAPELRRAVWRVAPHLPIGTSTDLATIAAESVSTTRFFSWAMAVFAIAAVCLTALAVYGLLSFAVTQRRREIGIRIALGATPASVGAMVVRSGLMLGGAGVLIGVALARAASRYMESILLEVRATDATVYAATAIGALLVALAASVVPAYHAVRVDPSRTLKE